MSDNVIWLETDRDIPVERVITAAAEADLDYVFVIGREKNGRIYLASSTGASRRMLWDVEQAKAVLLGLKDVGEVPDEAIDDD